MERRILLTGATGYVGGRLLRRLEQAGATVRCLARRPGHLAGRTAGATEVVAGDVLDRASLETALAGVHTAYYLVHALGAATGFEEREQEGARNFAAAARAQGVRRIIYLGGLGDEAQLSPHLRSRHEVGRILRASGVPTIEFRASIVIGSGSLSFEMIRALVERLPAMITPRWVRVPAQPIAIDDLLEYLLAALDLPGDESRRFEIGGADQVSYGDLMAEYARQRGLRRVMLAVPFLTPRLSSLWLGLVTPVYARIGRKLVDSMTTPTVVRDPSARAAFAVRPRGMREAIAAALRNEDREFAATRWFDAVSSAESGGRPSTTRFGNRIVDARSRRVGADAGRAFAVIESIGGANGWFAFDALWRIRGAIDLWLGGVGMRRGRPSAGALRPGAVIDFWRVEAYEPGRRLRLAAEMRLPGRAWLEFEVTPNGSGSVIRQTAVFDPRRLGGLVYWYALYPVHRVIFGGMLAAIARRAERPGDDLAPVAVPPERLHWAGAVPYVALHLGVLAVWWVGVSPVALAVCAALYVLRMFAITAFYHRYFSHRSFRAGRVVQFLGALAGTTAVQRGPLWWAAHHRYHHSHADSPSDPHSPSRHGFWWSHAGWFLTRSGTPTRARLVRDWARYPELRWLDRAFLVGPALLAAALLGLGAWLHARAPGLGTNAAQMFVWGFVVSTVVLYHATYTINSLAHRFGRRRFDTDDDSRNNWALALITLGEGWHNNHHHYPSSARQGFAWWEVDFTYYALRALAALGIVRDLKPVRAEALARGRRAK